MPSDKLTALQTEMATARAVIEPQIEGYRDFISLNIHPDTKAKVNEALQEADRRRSRIVEAQDALSRLNDDGYPTVPVHEVLKDVYTDLKANVDTIAAAFGKFAPIDEAVTASIVPGTPEQDT